MREADIYAEQVRALSAYLDTQLADVPDGLLHERPGPSLNTVGWNYWHLLRIWDLDVNRLALGQKPQEDAWHRGGYTAKTGYNPDDKGRNGSGLGVGYTDAEVDELTMSMSSLKEYQQQLLDETLAYLNGADDAELRRSFPSPLRPDTSTSPGERMQHLVAHSYNHAGELRYAKGMLGMHDATYPGPGK